jgi:hypothetical protein
MIPSVTNALAQSMVHAVALESSSTSLGTGVSSKVIETLDNSIRDQLQGKSHAFFLGVLISAFVVAIGVVLEGPEILHELWPSLFSWFTWTSSERLHKFERVIKKIAFVGWFLIGIGVFGEGVFEGFQNRTEGQLQTFNDILLRDARLTASTAKQSAIDAASAAGEAKSKAEAADTAAGSASLVAGNAENAAGIVANKASELDSQLSTTKTQLETVEAKRADLEKSLTTMAICDAPRVLRNWTLGMGPNRKSSADSLRPFAGFQAIIEVVPEAEARRAADNISRALSFAGWNIVGPSPPSINIADGVMIEWYSGIGSSAPADRVPSMKAAEALIDFLHSYFWQADSMDAWSGDTDIQPNGVKIRVGLKPPVEFVTPPGEKEFVAAATESNKIFENSQEAARQKGEQERSRQFEESLKTLPPEAAARVRAEVELRSGEFRKMREEEESRRAQPCHLSSGWNGHP